MDTHIVGFLVGAAVQLLIAALLMGIFWAVRDSVAQRKALKKAWSGLEETHSHFQDSVEFARTAWALPADYADWFTTDRFTVHSPRSLNSAGESQSPLHRIMCGGHPADLDQLFYWGSPRYREAVAHVLTNQTKDSVEALIEKMTGGYWEPMRRTLQTALVEGLVGLEPDFSHLRLEYPVARSVEELV